MQICVDPILQENLRARGIKAEVFDEVLRLEQKQKVLEGLDDFVSGWFLLPEGDCTLYRGVSLGAAMRDEMMLLFHMVAHYLAVLEATDGAVERVHHSASCLLPDIVTDVLRQSGVEVACHDDEYPYVCFRQAWERNAASNYSCVDFSDNPLQPPVPKRSFIGRMKGLRRSLRRAVWGWRHGVYYGLIMRNLSPLYSKRLRQGSPATGILLTEHSRLLPGDGTLEGLEPAKTIDALADRGVFPAPLKETVKTNPADAGAFTAMISAYENADFSHVHEVLQPTLGRYSELFTTTFTTFFSARLRRLAVQTDRLLKDFSRRNVKGGIFELAHPLVAQAATAAGKKAFLVAPNALVHNQFYTRYLAERCTERFKVVVHSEYDRKRYTDTGIPEGNTVMRPEFYRIGRPGIRPFKRLDSLKDATVLVIPYFAPAIYTYRLQATGSRVISYLSEVFEALKACGAGRAVIRHHPGMEGYVMNRTGFTFDDFNDYVLRKSLEFMGGTCPFEVEVQDAKYTNVTESVSGCDVLIGTVSGTILDALELGRNYVVYDRSAAPRPEVTTASLIYDAGLPHCRRPEELVQTLTNFENVDRDAIMRKYYPGFLEPKPENVRLEDLFR